MIFKDLIDEINKIDSIIELKKTIANNKIVSILVFMFIVWIIEQEDIWTIIDGLVTVGTLLAIIFNIYINAQKSTKSLEIIPIFFYLKDKDIKYKLKLDIPRKDITRSEIQGLLSNFLVDSTTRYNIDSMSDLEYLQNIYKIQSGESNELIIILSSEEFNGKKDKFGEFNSNKMEIV